MTAIVHGSYAGSVVIEDDYGLGEIPLTLLHRPRVQAVNSDREAATVYGRAWTREALILADDTVAELGLVVLPSCWACVDGPAVTTDHKDRNVCLHHAPLEG